MIIVDAQQLLYHIVWPSGGNVLALVESIRQFISSYPVESKKIIVFDKYLPYSAKDHEGVRCAGEGSVKFNVTHESPLPNRETIMKNKENKQKLSALLSSYDLGPNFVTESHINRAFDHDEADVSMISYLLQETYEESTIRIISDDTDVFVLLVYWVWKGNRLETSSVQMQRWNMQNLDIIETYVGSLVQSV